MNKKNSFLIISAALSIYSLSSTKTFAAPWGNDNHVIMTVSLPEDLFCNASYTVIHGHVDSTPTHARELPGIMEENPYNKYSGEFYYLFIADLAGSMSYGPDARITFNCRGYKFDGVMYSISFEVTQPYSILKGHTPAVTTLNSAGLTLSYSAQSSSYSPSDGYLADPGQVRIRISKI